MENKRGSIQKAYERILADQYIFDTLRQKLSEQSQLNEKFITKHILPLAQKFDPKITWQDILDYEKEALSQPTSLKLTDLENISGGKASNILLSCGLLALMGFAGASAANTASANFIPFTETKEYCDWNAYVEKDDEATQEEKEKYEYTDLGDVPFYLQADHLVDGLLWFKHPTENKAFFVMDRTFNKEKEAIYTYDQESPSILDIDKPSFEQIKDLAFTLLDIDNLKGCLKDIETHNEALDDSEDDGEYDGEPASKKVKTISLERYLQASFNEAKTKAFDASKPQSSQSVQLSHDNILYNYSRFYNPNFDFNNTFSFEKDSETFRRNDLSQTSMYASPHIASKTKLFKKLEWNNDIKTDQDAKSLAEDAKQKLLSQNWVISHNTTNKFSEVESQQTLLSEKFFEGNTGTNTYNYDIKILRNNAFTFWTLSPYSKTNRELLKCGYQIIKPFYKIPLVSSSIDMLSDAGKKTSYDCFNGSSEEVKEQIATNYINKFCEQKGLDAFKKFPVSHIAQQCQYMILADNLEVRIPTHIAIKKWIMDNIDDEAEKNINKLAYQLIEKFFKKDLKKINLAQEISYKCIYWYNNIFSKTSYSNITPVECCLNILTKYFKYNPPLEDISVEDIEGYVSDKLGDLASEMDSEYISEEDTPEEDIKDDTSDELSDLDNETDSEDISEEDI